MSFVPIFGTAPPPTVVISPPWANIKSLVSILKKHEFIVIHGGYSLIERKKGKKERHEHGGGEDRPTIVLVIGTTGRISFDRINDVIKVY
jgi:hypothetical protein